jgi:hypothetical protein
MGRIVNLPFKAGVALLVAGALAGGGLFGGVSSPAMLSQSPTMTTFPVNVNALHTAVNVPFSGQVATITDPGAASASDLAVVIDWGDHSPSTVATVLGTAPNFTVYGLHLYRQVANFPLTVHANDRATGASGTGADLASAGLLDGQSVNATANAEFMGQVARIHEPDQETASDFTAMINWGDGSSPTIGTVQAVNNASMSGGASGQDFAVNGAHTYRQPGNFAITVTAVNRLMILPFQCRSQASVAAPSLTPLVGTTVTVVHAGSWQGVATSRSNPSSAPVSSNQGPVLPTPTMPASPAQPQPPQQPQQPIAQSQPIAQPHPRQGHHTHHHSHHSHHHSS